LKGYKNIVAKVIKGLFKVSLVVVLFLFLLFFLVAGAVQVPLVQNKIVDAAAKYGTELTGYKATIEGIHIDWFDIVVLEEVVLWDRHNKRMIYLGEAEVDYTIISLLKGKLQLDNITLRDGEVNLMRYIKEDNINISEFIWKIQELTTPKVKRVGPPVPVEIPQFTLDNMLFSYNDQREPFMKEDYFDHNHFTLDSIHGIVTDLYAVLDTIMLTTHHLQVNLRESHLKIYELNTDFLLDKHQIQCSNMYAKVGDSELRDYFRFGYKDINDLSDFNTKTDIMVHLKESVVTVRDIAHFAPALKGIKDRIFISGKMKGRINNFRVDSLNTYFGKVGHIKGKLHFMGFPDVSETFMDINLKEINVIASDLLQYTGPSSNGILNKFGVMHGKGEFTGVVNDFAIRGAFYTGLGSIASDINFKINEEDSERSSYDGTLSTTNFEVGKLLGQDFVQMLDMNGTIKGEGFSIDKAAFNLEATIDRLGLFSYDYRNIVTNAEFSKRFFNGTIQVKDSNLVMDAAGKIDMKAYPEEFDIDGHIQKAQLEKLKLVDAVTHISTDSFNLDFKGTDIDSIVGSAKFFNTDLVSKDKEIAIKSLNLNVERAEDQKRIELSSDIIDASMQGDFQVKQLVNDMMTLYKEFRLFYDQDKAQIAEYYASKEITNRKKYVSDFTINLKNINHLMDLYYPGIYISQNTLVNGEFASGNTSRFSVYSSIDSLFYNGNELYRNTIDLSLSKLVDSSNVLATAYLTSGYQNFKNSFKSERFSFEGYWNEDKIDFSSFLAQKGNSNKISLNGTIVMQENNKQLIFRNSYMDVLDERWAISDTNSIDFNKTDLTFNYLKIFNKAQSIILRGNFSADEDKQASFIVNNFSLNNLNPIIDYKLNGVLNGLLKVRNIYKDLDLSGGLSVKQFSIDGFVFGDIQGVADWMETEHQLNIKMDLIRDNYKAINITGNIKPPTEDRKEIVNLRADFNSADLGFISPIMKGVMSDISGKVDGSLKITGSFSDLRLKGEANVENGKFKVDYLGSSYAFNDKIYFTEDQIKFRNMTLSDMNGNKAKLNGGIAYDGFRNFLVDIKGTYTDFNVLNTTEKDNGLFYGKAFVTGDFSVFGPFDDLEIRANARSEKNTKIYIPLTGNSEVSQKDYIKFVSRNDANKSINKDSASNFVIRMYFNMEITPDAYTEIIFDKRSGDIIRGRGEGHIELRYDSRGEMTMFGNYMIKEGWYNFTMAGIVNKEFVIDRGSRISWNGEPYEGTLDIKARYSQRVSLKPLVDTMSRRMPDMQRAYPTDVILGVRGNLMAPEISMDIDILRYPADPTLSTMISAFETKIKTDEQELNRQVFSLIMLRSFTTSSFSGVSAVGSSTVSELLSAQLSHFLSQADQNLEINVNLKNMDKDALNTFNLRFSYTALDGRLRISRDGSFQNVQSTSQANVSNIAGEWTVEYLLSQDGKLRIKLFNRINNNSLLSATGTTSTSAGTSLMHVQSFDNLRELFGRKKKKEEIEPTIPPDPFKEDTLMAPPPPPDTIVVPQSPPGSSTTDPIIFK
jgi:hypothetical protein